MTHTADSAAVTAAAQAAAGGQAAAIADRLDAAPVKFAGRFGEYSVPRPCPCGSSHADRATYWSHRLDAEERAESELRS